MSVSSDISNLFKHFGGSVDQYQEISRRDDEHDAHSRWPVVSAADPQSPSRDGQRSGLFGQPAATPEPRIEPVIPPAPQVPQAAPVAESSAWSAAGLQGLLAKLAQEGREEVRRERPVDHVRPQLDHLKIIAVVSAKGGVGKSTLAANLAAALQRVGQPVLALDLDPQNALHHHFQPATDLSPAALDAGIAQSGRDWRELGVPSMNGVFVLPHGLVDEDQRRDFEEQLETDPFWLARRLHDLQLAEGAVVIVDTPPGPSPYLRQALSVANIALVVSLADAASYTALPMIDKLIERYTAGRDDFLGNAYLINQVDNSRQLNKDIAQIMHGLLGKRVVGAVHRDQSITEALAYNRSVLDYDPHGRGCHDILHCAQALIGRLATHVRHGQPA
ncbi:cellulose biosynthesis protein BcsP [Pseudomonas sp. Q1-7]|uniref:cellulose biosynthesis protein BcsP n=1 Tax=Pseudomonas sp. Q1-7 TaxID=3020843 RepID=UPI0023001FAD|nr:cellulose biosynthesis protein BcsP [Pseudomonas sp. Q1-7]